jgi:hypothetical protein
MFLVSFEFYTPMTLIMLIKMCLNETHSEVQQVNISYSEWSGTSKCLIIIAFHLCFRICDQEDIRRKIKIEWNVSVFGLC